MSVPEELIDEFVDYILENITGPEHKKRGQMAIKSATYGPNEEGFEFVGISMCPEEDEKDLNVDITAICELFDDCDPDDENDEGVSASMHTRTVVDETAPHRDIFAPHLRFFGMYDKILFMVSIYLERVDLDVT